MPLAAFYLFLPLPATESDPVLDILTGMKHADEKFNKSSAAFNFRAPGPVLGLDLRVGAVGCL